MASNSMQTLLCTQDEQVKRWKAKVTQLRLGKAQVGRLMGEALQKEQNIERELGILQEKVA